MIFFTSFVWNISHSKKNSARYCHKFANVFMQSLRHSCRIEMKLHFLDRFSKKSRKISNLIKNPSSGNRAVPCGQTDRRTDTQTDRHTNRQTHKPTDTQTDRHMTKPIVAFRNAANAPKDKTTTSQYHHQNQ